MHRVDDPDDRVAVVADEDRRLALDAAHPELVGGPLTQHHDPVGPLAVTVVEEPAGDDLSADRVEQPARGGHDTRRHDLGG